MAFRFWRRLKIAPGVTLNLGKSGGSLSFGPRGAKLTLGPHGRRTSVGIPGTGLFYTSTSGRSRHRSGNGAPHAPKVRSEDRLTLGFFRRLFTSPEEQALVDGCRELALGDDEQAMTHLAGATHIADGLYLAGFLALKLERPEDAARWLGEAARRSQELDTHLQRYGVSATMSLPITDEVTAHVGPHLRGVLLGLVEAFQRLDRREAAVATLHRLRGLEPDDVVVRLSLAELLLEQRPQDHDACERVVRLAGEVENETPVHAALMLYKGRALRGLGLPEAARDTLTAALRRKKDRPDDLLKALRYERALAYGELGRKSRARGELEKLYAEDPDYRDVARRLGL